MIAADSTLMDLEALTPVAARGYPTALELVKNIRQTLIDNGVEVKPMTFLLR